MSRTKYNPERRVYKCKTFGTTHHLLMNQEMYQENGVEKSRTSRLDWSSSTTDKMNLETMIQIIAKAGYEVKKIERDGG